MYKINDLTTPLVPLGLGTNKIGGWNLFPGLNDTEGKAVVTQALELGINFIDTAYMYGQGHSETLIGQVLKNFDRTKIILATKGAQRKVGDNKFVRDNSPKFLQQTVEASLQRLNTDYLDVFYIHFPDNQTDPRVAVDALIKMQRAGKIRAIGLSNFSAAQIKLASEAGKIDFVENRFNLFQQNAKTKLWPTLKTLKINFVPYEPLAESLLTGRYNGQTQPPKFAVGDHRLKSPLFQTDNFAGNAIKVAKLQPIADKYHASIVQLVLAWYLANPNIAAVIPGARTVIQVKNNAGALKLKLSPADYQQIDTFFA